MAGAKQLDPSCCEKSPQGQERERKGYTKANLECNRQQQPHSGDQSVRVEHSWSRLLACGTVFLTMFFIKKIQATLIKI